MEHLVILQENTNGAEFSSREYSVLSHIKYVQ